MFLLREVPSRECLEKMQSRYPDIQVQAIESIIDFLRTAGDLIRCFDDFLARHGLTQGRFAILAYLNRNPEVAVNQTHLADAYGVTKATITGLIDGLERDALVERLPDPEDRRASLVRLTATGRQFLDALLPYHFRRTAEVFTRFTPADHAALHGSMGRIREGFDRVRAGDQEGTHCCPNEINCRRPSPPAEEPTSPAT